MKKQKVLLVEDNELSSELGFSFLEEAGYDCRVAANGEEALHALRSGDFDLVLMDVEMPVMDGLTATRKIRAELKKDVPVIALSGHTSAEEHEKCIAAGMNDCVVKPFQKEALYAAIAKQLKKNGAAKKREEATAGSTAAGAVTDLTYLRSIARNNEGFFTSMIRIFTEQTPEDVKKLDAAVHECDFETIRTLAHKIKTSVVFVGADAHVQRELVEMEKLGEEKKSILRIAELFAHVKKTCTTACEELTLFLAGKNQKSSG
ncbi:MAG TPA: response regulator [Bacteroidia bacterium]|nr:response regulator [Bacteroidia bacterium]